MHFQCSYQWKHEKETWTGNITKVEFYSGYYEIHIISRSSIRVLVGRFSSGLFACIPDFKASCCLSSLNDLVYNKERLIHAMDNVVDGVTVAFALKALSGSLSFE